MKKNREKKIIYISGYGRSGSTILEIFIAQYLFVFPTGEFANLFRFYSKNKICECGKQIQKCELWSKLLSKFENKKIDNLNLNTKLAESPITTIFYKNKWMDIWPSVITQLFEEIKTNVIIDSSKSTRDTFNRLKLLKSANEVQVCEILLIRNPEDVMKSAKKGSNKKIENGSATPVLTGGAIRAGCSWLLTNLFAFARFKKNKGIILTYEQFIQSPENILIKIKQAFNLYEINKPFSKHHGISGNRLRRNNNFIKIKKKKSEINLNKLEKFVAEFLKGFYRLFLKQQKNKL